jgi:hypothetical protein
MDDYKLSVVKGKFDLSGNVFPPTNPLDKILINSASLPVVGQLYSNAFISQTILDIDVNQLSTDPIVYFQPYFGSSLALGSNQPLQRIQISIFAQLEDGTQVPLLLGGNKSWSCKLLFARLF